MLKTCQSHSKPDWIALDFSNHDLRWMAEFWAKFLSHQCYDSLKEGRIGYFWNLFVGTNGDWDCQQDVWVKFYDFESWNCDKTREWKGCEGLPLGLPFRIAQRFDVEDPLGSTEKIKSHQTQAVFGSCVQPMSTKAQHLPHSPSKQRVVLP